MTRATKLIPFLALAAACSSDEPHMAAGMAAAAGSAAVPVAAGTMTPTTPVGTGAVGSGSSAAPRTDAMSPTSPGKAAADSGETPKPSEAKPADMMPANAEDCRGFSFENLKYSPGGNVLPNKCMPYHATTNNPYAVRCIDAWPWYKTQFAGDSSCILPPPPDKGVQYGVHPQGQKWFDQVSTGDMSGYMGLSDEWLMNDGEEEQANYNTKAATTTMQNYYRSYARMRPGSHHMIVAVGGNGSDTWGPAVSTGLGAQFSLPGAQRPDENTPKSLDKPVEDAGLYSEFPANPSVAFNMHHFNASGAQIFKEAWTNLWWESDATVQVHGLLGLELGQTVGLRIEPGEILDLHYSWEITEPVRLVTAFGHRHAWTTNFSSWVEQSDGELDIVYQSYQWLDEPTYRYDSMTENPVPAPANRTDGASSGIRMLMPGQKLHFNCHIEYTDERAKTEGAPKLPSEVGPIRFANEAFTAEMCILFGSTAAVQMRTPEVDETPLPSFAK